MSGASDKARFYQEQSVPELQELARKKIFTKPEVSSIAKKRSDFEHKILARGSSPADYARYAEYEMNLEALRRKRMSRLGVKATNYTGQRRIFFVLDRATRKFQGDVGLWMQYIGFARKQKSYRKVAEILTRLLRLHPAKPGLWIYAAKYAIEERGDVQEARSFLQRGLRFCGKSGQLWLEYARVELIYVAKIVGRRRVLGLDSAGEPSTEEMIAIQDTDDDVVALPRVTAGELDPTALNDEMDQSALEKLNDSPVLSGAILLAVFNAAYKKLKDERFAFDFFDMVAEFHELPCLSLILNHVLENLRLSPVQSPGSLFRHIRQPTIGVGLVSLAFPMALSSALSRIKSARKSLDDPHDRCELAQQLVCWMLSYLDEEELDADIREAIELTLEKVWSQYQEDIESSRPVTARHQEALELLDKLELRGMARIAKPGRSWASRTWPDDGAAVVPREASMQ